MTDSLTGERPATTRAILEHLTNAPTTEEGPPLLAKFEERRRLHVERRVTAWRAYEAEAAAGRRGLPAPWRPPCWCGTVTMDPVCAAALAAEFYADGWTYVREMDELRERAEARARRAEGRLVQLGQMPMNEALGVAYARVFADEVADG